MALVRSMRIHDGVGAVGRVGAIAAIVGALIGAAFGWVWLDWAADGLPEWRAEMDLAGLLVLGMFLVAGLVLLLRNAHPTTPARGERLNPARTAWFGVVVPVEVALIVGGQQLLGEILGHPEWAPVWTLLVVGAHFMPFGVILRLRSFHWLAGGLCAVAVVSALIAGFVNVRPLWWILPGVGGALVLWLCTGWALIQMLRGRWLTPGMA